MANASKGFLSGRTLLIAVPYLWLLVFFALPFVLVFKISLSDYELSQPPYFPQFDFDWTWASITDFEKATFPSDVASSMQPVMDNLGTQSRGGNEFIDVDAALGYEFPAI